MAAIRTSNSFYRTKKGSILYYNKNPNNLTMQDIALSSLNLINQAILCVRHCNNPSRNNTDIRMDEKLLEKAIASRYQQCSVIYLT